MKLKRYFLRALCLSLCLLCLLPLSSCSKYRLELSGAEESRVIGQVGDTPLTREVVNFFYLTFADAYPQESHETRMARVEDGIRELYAIFALCPAYGIDPYGDTVNAALDAAVREMIDEFPTRRDYIERITEQHMTDTVSRLLLRSYLCEELLSDAITAKLEKEEEMEAFLLRGDVIRVLSMTLDFGSMTEAMQRRAAEIMDALAGAEDTDAAFLEIARRKATSESAHTYITDSAWQEMCGPDGPAPALGTISGPLYEGRVCLIMRVAEKDLAYAKENPEDIVPSYLECAIRDLAATLSFAPGEEYLALTGESFV